MKTSQDQDYKYVSTLQGVQKTGIKVFINHPSQIADFLKLDFKHAEMYFDFEGKTGFSYDEVNSIVNQARASNKRVKLKHYTFIEKMIEVLISASYVPQDSNDAIYVKQSEDGTSSAHKMETIAPHTQETIRKDESYRVTYTYRYGHIFICSANRRESKDSLMGRADGFIENLAPAYYDMRGREYVKERLPKMLIGFLNFISPENNLDFEFVGRITSSNAVFQKLTLHGYYDVLAALLKNISPTVAVEQLQLPIGDNNKTTVLQTLIEKLPASTEAVAESIRALQALQWGNPNDFKIFIENGANTGLLQSLRDKTSADSPLLQDFLAIEPSAIAAQYRSASGGLNMPAKKEKPQDMIAAIAPPHSPQRPYASGSGSSSVVSSVVGFMHNTAGNPKPEPESENKDKAGCVVS